MTLSSVQANSLYTVYEVWKGWDNLFYYSSEDANYFIGETNGLRIHGGDVLEIGFGAGNFLAWAREQGARVAATEINPTLIQAARDEGVEILPYTIELIAEDYSEHFDTIVAFDVFEHFEIAELVSRLKACETMLKPGGHLLMRFPNGQSPFGLISQNGDATHRSSLSRQIIEQLTIGMRLRPVRYAPSFRVEHTGSWIRYVVRKLRYTARSLISVTLNAVYGSNIPWDPVVVLILEK